ncbi:3-phosphoshikimate 1-carboxyvinyltransferase [Pseudomonas dryadis]|uniref:3-phosphoshikimate 1-carboxyvinyltransferase n=2 Tax=Pseudomonadales TaxID=72274 RepID=A0A4Q9R746_9GAMM|nr:MULTISPECIES: 3-phosphoshikimate 1-carboxyvinyltransferase [Pseudomonas]TBU96374.1 3-phosphoshikimate 1-carboxyvinyltransferase [Pseudomonas dryadis]TBV00911.1 3-phosphoshikimate 1-carboxyvinyltransferase [Pseudomonas dryadis]TBV13601.1 3-phosphoshikimate 1-carboxyvinyltransferase [Pseudomonas sp. FRB 230]
MSFDEQDPFIKGLKERLPNDLRESFSVEQLEALKVAFGARKWGQHRLDLRGTLKLWRWRYYFVLLAGRNQRDLSRVQQELSLTAKAAVLSLFLLLSLLVGLLFLYLAKSALGINLFSGFSLGLWDWFRSG